MIENLIPKDERRELNDTYKLRSRFWMSSVCAHILWIFVATQIHLTPPSKRPVFDQFIRPLERRVLVYRPPVKTASATPETRVGKSIDPRGAAKSLRTIVATVPQAQSKQQIIFNPIKMPELKADIPAPDVVARMEAALPPPPPKPQAKTFTAPVRSERTVPQMGEIAVNLVAPSAVKVEPGNVAVPSAALPRLPKIAPKVFTPPPPSDRQPKLARPTEVNETLASVEPVAPVQSSPAILNSALPTAPKIPPKQFKAPASSAGGQKQATATRSSEVSAALPSAPTVSATQSGPSVPSLSTVRMPGPPRDLPPAPEAVRGNAQANIAIASVNPAPSAEVPASSRSGQFSVAPTIGEPSSGAATASALVVPNLTVREPERPKPEPAKSNTVIYAERVRSATATFTVPLRPANRAIPRAIDAHFPGRSVYTVLIPIENLPAYGGDWILWFAESAPLAGQTPSVKAPVPFRKIELLEKGREPADTRLQIAATLGVDGKLSGLKVLSNAPSETQEMALEDIGAWEWKPATRNGVPVAIEGVFEIPFRLPRRP